MRNPLLVPIVALLAVTACSGDDDPQPTTAPTTTVEVTTTTTPAPTTTNAPTTTEAIDEAAQKQAVIDAAIASWTAFNEAKLDPTSDEKLDRIREVHDGATEERMVEIIENFRTLNQASRTNVDLPASVRVDPESVAIVGDDATVESCEVNSNVLVEVGAAPDGADAVVDDSVRTSVSLLFLSRVAGVWLVTDGDRLSTDPEGTSCDG